MNTVPKVLIVIAVVLMCLLFLDAMTKFISALIYWKNIQKWNSTFSNIMMNTEISTDLRNDIINDNKTIDGKIQHLSELSSESDSETLKCMLDNTSYIRKKVRKYGEILRAYDKANR